MPAFSRMMSSYPMQFIRGLGSNVRMAGGIGAGIGGAYGASGRRGSVGKAVGYGAAGGALAAAGAHYGGTFARNMGRPGVASMLGRSAMGAGRNAVTSAGSMVASAMRRVGRML